MSNPAEPAGSHHSHHTNDANTGHDGDEMETTATPAGVVSAPSLSAAEVVWTQILDALEADLDRAVDAAEGAEIVLSGGWQPPAVAEPLPASLAARARELRDRQRVLVGLLPGMIDQTGKQMRATDHFAPTARRGSVYLDVSA